MRIFEFIKKHNLIPSPNYEEYLAHNGYKDILALVKNNSTAKKELMQFINTQEPVRKRMFKLAYENTFLPLECLAWIESNHQHIYTRNDIHIVDGKPISKDLIYHVERIIKWVASIAGKSPDIEVWIFLCPHKKVLPASKKPLGRNEVNSGVSYLNNWVQVFRREEVLKVLIHELLHYYDLDIKDATSLDNSLRLNGKPLLINEAYNEVYALAAHTLYYAKTKGEDLDLCWKKEVEHSRAMYHKIIDYYGIKEWSDFTTPKFVQHSNVFSYYILKYLLMENLNILMRPLKDKLGVIKDILNRNHEIKKYNYNLFDTSLRMSCLEL